MSIVFENWKLKIIIKNFFYYNNNKNYKLKNWIFIATVKLIIIN